MPGWPDRRTNTARVLVIVRDLLVAEVFASTLVQVDSLHESLLPFHLVIPTTSLDGSRM